MPVGSTIGVTGALIHHRSIGATSTRSTRSRPLSGDHQKPRVRPISSAAMNSAAPHETVGSSSETTSRSAPSRTTRNARPAT